MISSTDAKRYGAIVCWRHEWNGAELAHAEPESTQAEAVRRSIARLVEAGRPLDLWRCSVVSTPQTIYRDVTRGRRSKFEHPARFEGKLAVEILDELDAEV